MEKEKKPIIFSIDDDPQVLRSIKTDLRSAYKADYRIIATENVEEALEALPDLKKQGESVALFLSDQMMPKMLGVDFLEKSKTYFPNAKRVLLTAYSDINAAIKAINDVQLDYYLVKPWDPPEEKLYPVLDELLDEWQAQNKPEFFGIKLIGYQYSPKSHNIKDFLAGNLVPYEWLDIENNPKASEWLQLNQVQPQDLPLVTFPDGTLLKEPSLTQLAEKIGLAPQAKSEMYDVVIIGAGPAGLAAGVYGGSEGLKTLLIEKRAPGGQAGTSSRIENYLGFPNGLSGAELSRKALAQAQRFGIEFLSPQEVQSINFDSGLYKEVFLSDGSKINTRSIIITTGVDYRKLSAKGVDKFTGAGVYYGAAMTEARSCANKEVFIVGGGNSAGQGAVYLSKFAQKVTILIRKPDLTSSMSSYLIDQIEKISNIEVMGYAEVAAAFGDEKLEQLDILDIRDNSIQKVNAQALFIFIGSRPITDWMGDFIFRDKKGYIITGKDLKLQPGFQKTWKKDREPFLLETCQPGIFAAGDVRSGAMNRVASAVGEGAMAIKFVHEYLAEV